MRIVILKIGRQSMMIMRIRWIWEYLPLDLPTLGGEQCFGYGVSQEREELCFLVVGRWWIIYSGEIAMEGVRHKRLFWTGLVWFGLCNMHWGQLGSVRVPISTAMSAELLLAHPRLIFCIFIFSETFHIFFGHFRFHSNCPAGRYWEPWHNCLHILLKLYFCIL